jgi:monoamine oxidase
MTTWFATCAGPADFGATQDAIVIIGSGLAGLSAAAALHKVWHAVHIQPQ